MLEAVGIAFLILLLRATDVSLATLKTIFIIEGRRALAPSLGFFEATIYVIAASLVFTDLGNPIKILGFGVGFALGTALGMYLAQRLGLGSATLRLIKSGDAEELIDALRQAGFPLTTLSGGGRDGPVTMIQMNVRKRAAARALQVAQPWLASCFVTLGDEPIAGSSASSMIDSIRQLPGAPWAILMRKPHA